MAQELHDEQNLENLYAFGARLEAEYQKMLAERAETPNMEASGNT